MANIITAEELRALNTEELQAKLKDAKEELFNLRFQAATANLKAMVVSLLSARKLLGSTP